MYAIRTLENKSAFLLQDILSVLLATCLISLSGKIHLYLPFSPVPIGLQPTVILLVATYLGPRKAFLSIFTFLLQGALGFPVFSGAYAGIAYFFGPTGGYLLGYLIGGTVTGYFAEKYAKNDLQKFLSIFVGNWIIYLFGMTYLATFVGFQKAILVGILPFILGDILKSIAGVKILSWIKK